MSLQTIDYRLSTHSFPMKSDILNHEKIISIFKELEQIPALTQRVLDHAIYHMQ